VLLADFFGYAFQADGILAVLKAKPDIDLLSLQSMYHEFKYSFQDQIRERGNNYTYDAFGIPFKNKSKRGMKS